MSSSPTESLVPGQVTLPAEALSQGHANILSYQKPFIQTYEMRTLLHTVEPLYFKIMKYGHHCVQYNLTS